MSIVKNRKLPIATLDERWYELFPEGEKNSKIVQLEQNLNQLLQRQGQLGNDIKEMKALKKKLMDEIVENMGSGKKHEQNKKFIEDLNAKIEKASDELLDLPYLIKESNEKLIIESISLCYENLSRNEQEIAKITEWISRMRYELKNKILLKQDIEQKNTNIYSYMHDILGVDLIEEFANMVALAQITPGPVGLNAATYIGYKQLGFWGAVAGTLGVTTPSLTIGMAIAVFTQAFKENSLVKAALTGIRPATLGLIAAAVVFFADTSIFTAPLSSLWQGAQSFGIDWKATLIFVCVLVAEWRWKVNMVWLMLGAALLGCLLSLV